MTSQDPMFSAGDTPANPSAKPVKGKAKKTRDTYSHGSPTPFANYDPDTQSWKTYPVISLWDSEPYKGSWPRSGMTQDGIAYQLPPSAPRTSATAFSSSLHHGPNSDGLWPTATTQDHATRYAQGGMPLGMAARLFPTPTAKANQDSPNERKKWPWLFPTPTTQEIEHPTAEWTENGRRLTKNGNTHSMNLADLVQIWPTPVATGLGGTGAASNIRKRVKNGSLTEDEYKGMTAGNGGRLNPTWVEWLMGFPIGWTDLEDLETLSSPKLPNTLEGL